MKAGVEPLVNDGFAGEATKRTLGYLQKQREKGKTLLEFTVVTRRWK